MINIKETVISQYANSPIICRLISNFNESLDPSKDIKLFYDLFWNLETAQGVGLDFWGRVVGISREVIIDDKNQFIGSTLASGDLIVLFEKRGRAYFIKSGTMSARYVFEFNLTKEEKAVLISTNLLPKPTGVLVDFYEPDISKTFGFKEANMAPFGEGAFYIGDR